MILQDSDADTNTDGQFQGFIATGAEGCGDGKGREQGEWRPGSGDPGTRDAH